LIKNILLIIFLSSVLLAKDEVSGLYKNNKEVKHFINYMIRTYNFKRSYLIETFSKASKPRKFKSIKRKRKVIRGMPKGRRWWLRNSGYTRFEKAFLTKDRVLQGVKFVKRYKTLFNRIEKKLKVDKYIVAAVIGVESYYGEIVGHWEAFNMLCYKSFKKKQRAKLYKYELANLLLLSYRQGLNALYLKGSTSGALGIGQLLPHNYIKYGVSFDDNKKIEPFSCPDSIATVANFLHKKGWKFNKEVAIRTSFEGKRVTSIKANNKKVYKIKNLKDKGFIPRKHTNAIYARALKLKRAEFDELWLTFYNFKILKRYNNSNYYAMAVYELSEEIKKRVEKKDKNN
jgi:membrane-bound lytic murein transglycosylase B